MITRSLAFCNARSISHARTHWLCKFNRETETQKPHSTRIIKVTGKAQILFSQRALKLDLFS